VVVIMRPFYSKTTGLCQFFQGEKFLAKGREILCYNQQQDTITSKIMTL
jgi:hypothetical protein